MIFRTGRVVIPVTILGVIAVLPVSAGQESSSRLPETPVLERAPDLTLESIHGKKVKLDYAAAGLTLVNFWAVWCVPCHEEIPQISDMVDEYGPGGFQVYGIAMDSGGAPMIRRFLAENPELGVNYPILLGDATVAQRFGNVLVLPATFLVASDGTVLETYVGVTEDFGDTLARDIVSHLPKKETSRDR